MALQQLYLYLSIKGMCADEGVSPIGVTCEVASRYREFDVTDVKVDLGDPLDARTLVYFIFSTEPDGDLQEWAKKMVQFGKQVARRLGLSMAGVRVYFAENRWNVYEFNRTCL